MELSLWQTIVLALCGGNAIIVTAAVVVVGSLVFVFTRPGFRRWIEDCKRDWNAFGGPFDG